MSNPKLLLAAFCIAVGFILAVAFHSAGKTQVAASAQIVWPIASAEVR